MVKASELTAHLVPILCNSSKSICWNLQVTRALRVRVISTLSALFLRGEPHTQNREFAKKYGIEIIQTKGNF